MFYQMLKKACKNAGTTVTATLKAIGIGTANGTYWKNGSMPTSDILIKLSEFLNVSTDYLLFGKENNLPLTSEQMKILKVYDSLSFIDKSKVLERAETLAEIAAEEAKINQQPVENTIAIPFFDTSVSAGTGIDIDYTYSEQIKISSAYSGADFAVQVSGDSMEPRYKSGDIVLVKSTPFIEIGEIGIFILNSRSYIKERGENELISLNDKYDNIPLSEGDSIYCQGKVIGVLSANERR